MAGMTLNAIKKLFDLIDVFELDVVEVTYEWPQK